MNEIWEDYIKGYYKVSTTGEICSVDRQVLFHGNYALRKGIILKQTKNSKGYLTVVICIDGTRKTIASHRAIAETFIPNPLELPQVNHIDGNPLNNDVNNLEWCTASDNQKHAYATGLKTQGEMRLNAKLTAEDVYEIADMIYEGYSNNKIAEKYGVTKGSIEGIKKGRSWAHLFK